MMRRVSWAEPLVLLMGLAVWFSLSGPREETELGPLNFSVVSFDLNFQPTKPERDIYDLVDRLLDSPQPVLSTDDLVELIKLQLQARHASEDEKVATEAELLEFALGLRDKIEESQVNLVCSGEAQNKYPTYDPKRPGYYR